MESDVNRRPLRVMLASKFFYRRGGAEIHVIELERLLHGAGVATAVFAMAHAENIEPCGELFTAPEVGFDGSLSRRLRGASRLFGGAGVGRAFREALDSFRPDVVHLHNVHSYLSPVMARIASRRGVKVVWTLHDHKLVCPAYVMRRDGTVCTECFSRPLSVVSHRCMKGSLAASLSGYLEARMWNRRRIDRTVGAYICPSGFLGEMMVRGGYPAEKMLTVHNFTTITADCDGKEPRSGVCYIGRLSEEKGVATLIEAARGAEWHLTIAGGGAEGERLMRLAYGLPNVSFAGVLDREAVGDLLGRSEVAVVPSEWNENCSLSIIEALWSGTPVVASRMGGNPELVGEEDGMLFAAGDIAGLRAAIDATLALGLDNNSIARRARERFSPESYLPRILEIYSNL